jgi:hypothetical protein
MVFTTDSKPRNDIKVNFIFFIYIQIDNDIYLIYMYIN